MKTVKDMTQGMDFILLKGMIQDGIDKKDITELARIYAELKILTDQISESLDTLKKFLSKFSFKESFEDLGVRVTDVEGKDRFALDVNMIWNDVSNESFVKMASITEKALREHLVANNPRADKKAIEDQISIYKKRTGKTAASVLVSKLEEKKS